MNTDFLDAHERHWGDAEYLNGAARLANADHLYGAAAECGLKRLMIRFGMVVDHEGAPADRQSDRRHVNIIWERYETYRSGAVSATEYVLSSPNPFLDWDVNQRYANRNNFDEARVGRHKKGAEEVRKLIGKAQKDGLL